MKGKRFKTMKMRIGNLIIITALIFVVVFSTILVCYAESDGSDSTIEQGPQFTYVNGVSNMTLNIFYDSTKLYDVSEMPTYNYLNTADRVGNSWYYWNSVLSRNSLELGARYGSDTNYIGFFNTTSPKHRAFVIVINNEVVYCQVSYIEYESTRCTIIVNDTNDDIVYFPVTGPYTGAVYYNKSVFESNSANDYIYQVILANSIPTYTTYQLYKTTVPAGYSLLIKKSGTVHLNVKSTFNEKMPLFGTVNRGIGYVTGDTIPQYYDLTNNGNITQLAFSKTDTYSGSCDFVVATDTQYVTIVNPAIYGQGSNAQRNNNLYVTSTEEIIYAVLIPLERTAFYSGNIVSNGTVGIIDSNGNITSCDISSTGAITTSQAIYTPVAGGKDTDTYNGGISGFSSLVDSAKESIKTLYTGSTSFISTLGSLYGYLPNGLSNVITSALVVIIGIGVFKAIL